VAIGVCGEVSCGVIPVVGVWRISTLMGSISGLDSESWGTGVGG
jgi:hypothetical protein